MALTASVDLTQTPIRLTVVSDRRKVSGTVTVGGETANYSASFPVSISDDSGRVWSVFSDDGATAVYTS